MSELTDWYGCAACGEMRRLPFEANGDDPGCRCAPAERTAPVDAAAVPSDGPAINAPDHPEVGRPA